MYRKYIFIILGIQSQQNIKYSLGSITPGEFGEAYAKREFRVLPEVLSILNQNRN